MYLKRLELSGFKSFAKHTVLEFSSPISAIVGPNGSGKSNVAEAIRWVLGEQSMKSLRGKRGDDLIFAGSHSSPRLGRASVAIVFNNTDRHFNLDFDEVVIERVVFRDGLNEYFLNGSKVRLKDIIELLAGIGLGSSQHHIIRQGEADRILYASPRERREMIEDALGIRIYQLKRKESERKLERTEENMRQVSALRKEIQPHLKFLRAQAEKAQKASEIRENLKAKMLDYISREKSHINAAEAELAAKKNAPAKELAAKEHTIKILRDKLSAEEKASDDQERAKLLQVIRDRITDTKSGRSQLERELGRLEGIIEAEQRVAGKSEPMPVSAEEINTLLKEIDAQLESAFEEDVLDSVFKILRNIKSAIVLFVGKFKSARTEKRPDADDLKTKMAEIESALEKINEADKSLQAEYNELLHKSQNSALNLRGMERQMYELEKEASAMRDQLRTLEFAEERLKMRAEELVREIEEAQGYFRDLPISNMAESFPDEMRETLKREVEKLKVKFEEAGGVDPSVVKEFEEVRTRDEFFEKEIDDLAKAAVNLRQVIKELEEKLESDFKNGIAKINAEFQKHFETMFGGGKAELWLSTQRQLKKDEDTEDDYADDDEEEGRREAGIEVSIDLPRKRIKSLDMLSGGERALSSIALLFALSAVNPPPFLVLDETDAALDEANSRRYGAMLLELAKNTQLVVVTHNRETMRNAGILYGVTMSSDSISKLLSIRLGEAEKIAK